MTKPLIAIVGRPNVGKSALFNRLARKRIALVEDFAGTTRDRLYADCDLWGRECTVIDTGGLDPADDEGYMPAVIEQAQFAMDEADVIIFLTDGREEPTTLDYEIADMLRRTKKPVILTANKLDNVNMQPSDMFALHMGAPVPISAVSGVGVAELTEQLIEKLPPEENDASEEDDSTKIAIVGRPNVGKSALTNRILGYERSIVSAQPGTTRDAIDTKLEWNEQPVTLIDTAGMRRKARVRAQKNAYEYHMVLRSLRAIDRSTVAMLVLESGGVIEQDTKIAGYAHEAGKAVIIVVNKWDLIEDSWSEKRPTPAQKDYIGEIQRYLPFINYAPIHFISALEGTNVPHMLDDALQIAPNLTLRASTAALNNIARRAMAEHPPPSVKGKAVKIRYITQAETVPPRIIVFCNRPDDLHFSYLRYLENQIRAEYPFRGVPLKIELRKSSEDRHDRD